MSQMPLADILGMGSVFPHSVAQPAAARMAATLCAEDAQQAQRLTHLFERTGVEERGSVLATRDHADPAEGLREFYRPREGEGDHGPTTAQRMQRYATAAPPLAIEACRQALTDAELSAVEITDLITVSCTGFFAPGLDVALIRALRLRASVHRLHIGFMGCHAAFNALATAADLVAARPEARVLVVCVELCTLHFSYGWQPQRLVANSLFADGAAAVVVGAGEGNGGGSESRLQVLSSGSLLLPGSEEAMTWRIGDHGFEMTLLPEVPALIRQHVRPWLEEWLGQHGRRSSDIGLWAIHPGGPKVLSAVCQSLGVSVEAAGLSRQVLARHGNLSSATILVILERMRRSAPGGDCVALGFGPGLMAECLLLHLAGE